MRNALQLIKLLDTFFNVLYILIVYVIILTLVLKHIHNLQGNIKKSLYTAGEIL